MSAPTIQTLCKQDFTQQHIVSLPDAEPLPPLSPSSVRVKTYIFSLTANNVTYAKSGHLSGWWDVHPLPPSVPGQFKDAEKYGRISAWGYGVVKESNRDDLPIGSLVYGYLPIGTLPVDLELSPSTTVPGQFHESSAARAKQFPPYNELNRYVFAWDEASLTPPMTFELGLAPRPPWTMEHADMNDAVVILLAASGKNAVTFARQLKFARPAGSRPRKVIAVTSQTSKAFVEATGFYDLVCLYGDLVTALKPLAKTVLPIGIGSEPKVATKEQVLERISRSIAIGMVQVNACDVFVEAAKKVGKKEYEDEFSKGWGEFLDAGGVPGLKMEVGEGMDAVGKGWDKICSGELGPETGLVFKV